MDEIDELIEMAADARKRLVDAQRQYDEIKRRIGRRAEEAKQAATTEVERPISVREAQDALADMLPVKAPVVDGVVDYDDGAHREVISWHRRQTFRCERVAWEILAICHKSQGEKSWCRLDEFMNLNVMLSGRNSIGAARASVRLAATVALAWADEQSKMVISQRWSALATPARSTYKPDSAASSLKALTDACKEFRSKRGQSRNVTFYLLAYAALTGVPNCHTRENIPDVVRKQAIDNLASFSAWMAGSDS